MLPACDSFQLDCTIEDVSGLQSCAKLGAARSAQRISGGSIEVWAGPMDKRFAYELLNDPFDPKSHCIKWHNILLRTEGRILLSVTQNGEEVGLHQLDKNDIAFLLELTYQHDIALYYWENAESGSTVPFLESFGDSMDPKI